MAKSTERKLYTTHQVAKLLGVTPITVIRWIEDGKLKCFTTVGGHRRIEHEELARFAQSYNLPWHTEEEVEQRKEFVVLAVDDEANIRALLKEVIEDVKGVKLFEAENAFSAGAKLAEESPDVVLLDFKMPGLDGFEFCRYIRQDPRFKDMPVIAMTGMKSEAEQTKMKEVGITDYLFKPFTPDQVVDKINRYRNLKSQTKART